MSNPLTKPVRFLRNISSRVIAISDGQNELFRRLDGLEGRIGAIEGRIGAIEGRIGAIEGRIGAIEGRIGDLSQATETRHKDMWKLISDINNSLPMTVAMSTTESLRQQTETIRSDIADTRQEIAGVLSKVVAKNE
jgi:chromosome segregation ATPase